MMCVALVGHLTNLCKKKVQNEIICEILKLMDHGGQWRPGRAPHRAPPTYDDGKRREVQAIQALCALSARQKKLRLSLHDGPSPTTAYNLDYLAL